VYFVRWVHTGHTTDTAYTAYTTDTAYTAYTTDTTLWRSMR
jgi:hypothetical protein